MAKKHSSSPSVSKQQSVNTPANWRVIKALAEALLSFNTLSATEAKRIFLSHRDAERRGAQ